MWVPIYVTGEIRLELVEDYIPRSRENPVPTGEIRGRTRVVTGKERRDDWGRTSMLTENIERKEHSGQGRGGDQLH